MPLPIAHGLLGASIVAAIHPKPTARLYLPLFIGAILANTADFDFGFSVFFGLKGWHRGFTHSIFFALIFTLVLMILFGKKRFRETLAFGLAYSSHCILDFATTKKGNGLEFLFPFSTDRFGLRWFGLSEIPSRLSMIEILNTIGLELLIFAPILVFVLRLRTFVKKGEIESL
jgi:inner membrane protein